MKKINSIYLVLLTFLFGWLAALPIVEAAANLQVIAFSCSPNEVKVGDLFSCSATVTNNGDATGLLGTATLYSDGSWMESTSYSKTVNTNINAGASASVEFSGLKGRSSGNNGFSKIMLDNVADTYVTSSDVNVINIAVIETPSSTSAVSRASVDVTGQAMAGGNVDITMAFSVVSGGCSIGSQAASASQNNMLDGQSFSRTWTLTMGSSSCSYSISAEARSNPVGIAVKTNSDSGMITYSSGGGSSNPPPSGGGGGGAAANRTNVTTTVNATTTTQQQAQQQTSGEGGAAGEAPQLAPGEFIIEKAKSSLWFLIITVAVIVALVVVVIVSKLVVSGKKGWKESIMMIDSSFVEMLKKKVKGQDHKGKWIKI